MIFMASFAFRNDAPVEQLQPLLQAERARVTELMEQGVIKSLYLTTNLRRGWIVLRASSLKEAEQAMASLPLHRFMELELVPLLEQNPGVP